MIIASPGVGFDPSAFNLNIGGGTPTTTPAGARPSSERDRQLEGARLAFCLSDGPRNCASERVQYRSIEEIPIGRRAAARIEAEECTEMLRRASSTFPEVGEADLRGYLRGRSYVCDPQEEQRLAAEAQAAAEARAEFDRRQAAIDEAAAEIDRRRRQQLIDEAAAEIERRRLFTRATQEGLFPPSPSAAPSSGSSVSGAVVRVLRNFSPKTGALRVRVTRGMRPLSPVSKLAAAADDSNLPAGLPAALSAPPKGALVAAAAVAALLLLR